MKVGIIRCQLPLWRDAGLAIENMREPERRRNELEDVKGS